MPANPEPTAAPYGTWKSPITSSMIAKMARSLSRACIVSAYHLQSVSLEDVLVDPVTSAIYYIEKRPEEDGRNVIVSLASGLDIFGREWNARTAVHEYGGAPAVIHGSIALFSNFSDGQVYKVNLADTSPPIRLTNKDDYRFANFSCHPQESNLVVGILEDHTKLAPQDVVNSLVCVNTNSALDPVILVSGSDFYATPQFNADGTLLAWTEWSHPDMPWDGEQVFVGAVEIKDGQLQMAPRSLQRFRIAGQSSAISAVQPTWLDTNTLVFSCDVSGFHNPWVATVNKGAKTVESRPVLGQPEEFDFTDPSWWLGESNISVLDEDTVFFAASRDGRTALYVVRLDGTCSPVECPYVHVSRMRRMGLRKVVFLGSTVDKGPALVLCSLSDSFTATYTPLRGDSVSPISDSLLSRPVPLSLLIPSRQSAELTPLHLVYYPPKNPLYESLAGEKPPAVVNVHGGPTYVERQNLSLEKQFFTSRGWFWIDVNYSGSSNYGREYAKRLKGNWGASDVYDCVQAVLQLSIPERALIDRKRVVIRGGSAGGYTTLAVLSQSDPNLNVFAAGTSSYGVSDLRKLTELTHKFQSWYVQGLVGGSYDEIPEIYRARSPVFHAHNIKVPLLILQGSLDPIVPPNQAEDMIKVIGDGGGSAEYTVFEGESHGWRKAENIAKALELEVDFYERALHLV
ncbi:alpha/beta-hydrolase [Mycena vitilis]|nr:alpha/beta-hydrolase [Mycena vitilis]